jgi:hypothetical protein
MDHNEYPREWDSQTEAEWDENDKLGEEEPKEKDTDY